MPWVPSNNGQATHKIIRVVDVDSEYTGGRVVAPQAVPLVREQYRSSLVTVVVAVLSVFVSPVVRCSDRRRRRPYPVTTILILL
mmetsp:Transcript_18434/g.20841  ORF Transcript_18434/g.20841 Transcript_18434/m.20841 type:complete len:84 (-) Transcript_18434:1093-1344(-)